MVVLASGSRGSLTSLAAGNNPFSGFSIKIVEGRNRFGYRPWTTEELQTLWDTPPKRQDLCEVVLVALHSGMRLNEIASLTWRQIKQDEGVDYFDVEDSKSPAGVRHVPIHPVLSWLVNRKPAKGIGRIWPKFNPEGPGKKPGADAGNDFSRYKIGLGFKDRRKTFHSFRKNVTGQMERAGVPESAWAQILGHEKGLTYGVYSPDGLTISQKAKIISKIEYPEVELPLVGAPS
jgi:integrase